MKINCKVPENQQPVLDYIRTIGPISKTLNELIDALVAVSNDEGWYNLPKSVQVNKCFDGGHTYEEGLVHELVKKNKVLNLWVQKQGDPTTSLTKQLKKSDRFFVSFVSPKKKNDKNSRNPGLTFVIMRNGTILPGINTAVDFTSST